MLNNRNTERAQRPDLNLIFNYYIDNSNYKKLSRLPVLRKLKKIYVRKKSI